MSTGSTATGARPSQQLLRQATPEQLRADRSPAGSMGPKVEAAVRFVERTGRRAAIGALAEIEAIVDGEAGTQVVPASDRQRGSGGATMASSASTPRSGKLRKVMVHRPDLSLQRLTPTNHDDLLFDDVLWVERAQYEHDQFVARMRERGVEVFLPAGPARRGAGGRRRGPRAADRARRRRSTPSACRWSTRSAPLLAALKPRAARQPPDRRADGRRGRARPRRGSGARPLLGGRARRHQHLRPATAAEHAVHPRLVVLDLRRRVDQPDVLARPAAGGLQRRRDLPRPPDVRRRRLRVLVPARSATTGGSTSRTSAAPRSRAATCSRSATAPC